MLSFCAEKQHTAYGNEKQIDGIILKVINWLCEKRKVKHIYTSSIPDGCWETNDFRLCSVWETDVGFINGFEF